MKEPRIIKEESEQSTIRQVSFMTDFRRYDLVIFESENLDGKVFIIDLQSSHYVSINKNELKSPKYYAHHFHINEYEAEEIHAYLKKTLG